MTAILRIIEDGGAFIVAEFDKSLRKKYYAYEQKNGKYPRYLVCSSVELVKIKPSEDDS